LRLYPVISHVIPLRLLQTLNLHRWNCNVFAWSRKITVLNYVRNLSGLGLPLPAGAAARPRLKAWPCSPAPPAGRRIFGGGFAPLGASLRRVAGVSRLYWCNSPRLAASSTWAELDRAPLTAQFLPFGGGEVAVRGGEVEVQGGMVPKVQTTSAKNADNRLSWAKWSAFWAKLSRTWCVVRTRTRYSVR
jgi:hypothetical protein